MTTALPVPEQVDDMTTSWLTAALTNAQWLGRRSSGAFERLRLDPLAWHARYGRQAERVLDSYGDRVPAAFARLVRQLQPSMALFAEAFSARRRTLTHGDLHLDNLILALLLWLAGAVSRLATLEEAR